MCEGEVCEGEMFEVRVRCMRVRCVRVRFEGEVCEGEVREGEVCEGESVDSEGMQEKVWNKPTFPLTCSTGPGLAPLSCLRGLLTGTRGFSQVVVWVLWFR